MTASSSSSTLSTSLKKNDIYYFDVVVFQVEDEIFKVPKEQLARHSPVFSDMFKLPQSEESKPEGHDDSRPIVLSGVSKVAFITLLKVLYPQTFCQPKFYREMQSNHKDADPFPLYVKWELAVDECFHVFKLAEMWLMEDIKDLMILKINSFMQNKADPIQKVVYGREHQRTDWLLKGYEEIVAKQEILPQDVAQVGSDTALELMRQVVFGLQGKTRLPLEDVFAEEVKQIRDAGAAFPTLGSSGSLL